VVNSSCSVESRKALQIDQSGGAKRSAVGTSPTWCGIPREVGGVKIDGTWWILLRASETKEKRADERPIEDDDIGDAIDKYLKFYRPILAGRGDNTNALWLAINGEAMAQCSVSEVITDTTRSTLGVAISPHLFRAAAAATAAIHAGDKPHLGSALLHHSHPTVTLENYNRASSISAGRAYRNVIERFRSIKV